MNGLIKKVEMGLAQMIEDRHELRNSIDALIN